MRTSAVIGLLVLAALGLGPTAGDVRGRPRPTGVTLAGFRLGADAVASPRRALRAGGWHGGVTTASNGESVRIEISDSYPPEAVSAQLWADFFAGLVHGSELAGLNVRIAPPDEVSLLCASALALGCYSGGLLVVPGEQSGGVAPEEIARHEYGHHVAANRQNPPWRAVDWGTKRWASREDVCAGTASGALHPGDQGAAYRLNPGEAFAEVYRILSERRGGLLALTWSVVDDRFIPSDAELAAVERDVLRPWTPPPVRRYDRRFVAGRPAQRRVRLTTPLDGILSVTLRLPRGRSDRLELVAGDGRTILARGLWAGASRKRLTYEICGRRAVELRVTRIGPAGSYSLAVSQP
jgi:hypothetical protein